MDKKVVLHDIRSVVLVVISSFIYAIAIKMFVESAHLIPAGFIGFSLLITKLVESTTQVVIPYMMLYLIIQIGLTLLVFRMIGKRFALLSILQYTLTTLFSTIIPVSILSDDIILVALFGGVLTGTSVLLALMGEASTGGTDFIAVYFQNKSNTPIWEYIMYFNWVVIIISALFFGIEPALYSMLFQYVSTTLVNNYNSRNRLISLTIITAHGDEVSKSLLNSVHHGVTVSDVKGAFSGHQKQMLFMVVNQFEVNEVVHNVRLIDPSAFINVARSEKIIGNFKKKKIV